MAYNPTPNVFVNGQIIDGPEIATEFNKVSEATKTLETSVQAQSAQTLTDAKAYTDDQINNGTIDGGAF